jgi:methyl-accepting chemotaxis protein
LRIVADCNHPFSGRADGIAVQGNIVRQRSINSSVIKAGTLVLGSTILAGAVGGGAILLLNDGMAHTNQISNVLRNHLESDMMHDALRSDVLAALAANNPAYNISIEDVQNDLNEHSAHFLNMIDTNSELTAGGELGPVIDSVKPALETYIDTAMSLVERAQTDEAAAFAMLPGFLESFGELEGAMAEASDQITAAADRTLSNADAVGLYAKLAMAAAALLAIGSVIFIVMSARRRIIRPIVDLTGAMDKLAGGDTNVKAPHADRDDEIGRMAGALSKFRENAINRVALEAAQRTQDAERAERSRRIEELAGAFGDQLAASLSTLRESSTRLQSDAATLEDVCEEANESARNAIDATAGANANVQTIAAATTELSASIQEIASRMSESARSAEQASSQGTAAGATAQQLADSARGIDEIVSLIGSVAEQTNLLALNATIEAARAGEMGRGFAVVASEVKGLASQTSRATEDVSRRIAEIQGISARSTEQVGQMVQLIEQMKQLSVAVAAAAEEQSAATNNIAENVNSAASRSDEARNSVAAMSGVTAKTREATDSVQASARSVEDLAQQLNSIARDFLTKLKAA